MTIKLSPLDVADKAEKVYRVNESDPIALKVFLNNKLFSRNQKALNATVGGRLLLKTQDSFGLCVMGAGAYKDDKK